LIYLGYGKIQANSKCSVKRVFKPVFKSLAVGTCLFLTCSRNNHILFWLSLPKPLAGNGHTVALTGKFECCMYKRRPSEDKQNSKR